MSNLKYINKRLSDDWLMLEKTISRRISDSVDNFSHDHLDMDLDEIYEHDGYMQALRHIKKMMEDMQLKWGCTVPFDES